MMRTRICNHWMDNGVTIADPATTWIDSRARIGTDTIIRPFSYVEGRARIGAGCSIGPYAYIADGALVADGSSVGPGVLTALDAAGDRRANVTTNKKLVQVVRRPPTPSSARMS